MLKLYHSQTHSANQGLLTISKQETAKQKEGKANGTRYNNTPGKTLVIIKGWMQLFIVNVSHRKKLFLTASLARKYGDIHMHT